MPDLFKQVFSALVNLAKNNYPLAYYYAKIWILEPKLKQEFSNPSIILVYQMTKVGSSSLFYSLRAKATNINQPVYQIHSLNIEDYKRQKQLWKMTAENPERQKQLWGNFKEFCQGKYLSQRLEILLNKKELKIITVVRDPVAQMISRFFESIERYFPDFQKRLDLGEITVKDLTENFWSQQNVNNKPNNVFNWFEYEFKKNLDIDIFSINFHKNEGYKIARLRKRKIDILILKLESFDNCLEEAMIEFLSLDKFKAKKANIGSKKSYAKAYAKFKQAVNFPQEYLDQIYEHKRVRHFYSEEEIEKFKLKWQTSQALN